MSDMKRVPFPRAWNRNRIGFPLPETLVNNVTAAAHPLPTREIVGLHAC